MPEQGVEVQILSWAPGYQLAESGRLAQLEERHVYTVDVRGSSPLSPTDFEGHLAPDDMRQGSSVGRAHD